MDGRGSHDHHRVRALGLPAVRSGPPVGSDQVAHWARALAHPTRVAVLRELSAIDVASPQVLAKRLGEPLGPVAYHVRTLRGWSVVELTGTTPRRGAIEHHYRLAPHARPIIRALLSIDDERP